MTQDTKKAGKFWAFVATKADGALEQLVGTFTGRFAHPLCCVTEELVEKLKPIARDIANQTGQRVRLVEYSNPREIEVFEPELVQDAKLPACPECGQQFPVAEFVAFDDDGNRVPRNIPAAQSVMVCPACSACCILQPDGKSWRGLTDDEIAAIPEPTRTIMRGARDFQKQRKAQAH